jgi:hypothetical protein
LQQFLNKVNFSTVQVRIHRSHTGIIVRPVLIDEILRNNITTLQNHVKGEYVIQVLHSKCDIVPKDIIININTVTVGCGYISSESYVMYMKHNSAFKVMYLSHKEDYAVKTCTLNTIPYPKMCDKPLDNTTICF